MLLSLWIYPLFLYPCYRSLWYSLSHPCLYVRWPTQGTVTTTTTGTTMERTTRMSTRCHPLHVLLSKCWLCKHKCFKLRSRPCSTCRLKKLQVVLCNNHEKVMLSSHQLSGPVADWWDAYVEAHEEPESINWPDFRATFRPHHVSQEVIKLKKKVFQDLK
jgi:hypothetical protein